MNIRKNIESLSEEDLKRFSLDWKTMNKNIRKRESSLLFEVGRIHGYPDNRCFHGVPQFLFWHRLYLLEFEKKLQEADIKNGYDGLIKLPYWNWIETKKLPEICYEFDYIPNSLLRRTVRVRRRSSKSIQQILYMQ